MRIVDKIKILSTPYEGHYHLYIPSNKKHVLVGKQEKKWLEQLIGQDFTISDLLVLVGEKHYLRFYAALSKMGLIDSMKSRKINIFKISWDFNITLSEKIIYKKFNKVFEKILFGIFPLSLILQCFIIYVYRADIFTNFQNFPITLNTLLFWWLVVIISATIHEFSHAIVAKNYQIEIPNCGIMLLLFNLAFFVDLSGVQFLKNKKQFLKIMLAGIASNSILSLIGLLVSVFTSYKLFGLLFFIINLGMIFINSIPFFQYDSGIILRYLNSNNNNFNFQYIVQLLIAFIIIYFPLNQLLHFLIPNVIVRSIGGVVISILLSILYMRERTKYVLRK